jgi:TonB family protein
LKKNKFDQPEVPVLFEEMAPPEPQPQIRPDEVAALKPGASNFGMPDEFKEDQFIASIPETIPLEEHPEEHEESKTSEIKEEPSEELTKKTEPKPEPSPDDFSSQDLTKIQTEPKQIKQEESKPKTVAQEEQKQKIIQKQPQKQTAPQKIQAPIKKELTFNELAQGFLSSLNEGGNDLMERKGNENIRPDFEEMRYLSYLHKIVWYMQNEWRRDTTIINCGPPVMVVTGVSITIDKNGILKNASIVQSCGNHQLDEAIIRGIHAASPYPPLPVHLNKDVLTVEFGVKHVGYSNNRSGINFHFG